MALEHKNAVGIFPDRQHTESALDQLKAADFPMNKVSVVAQHVNSEDVTIKATEATVQSEAQFVRDRTIKWIEHGALDAGSLWRTENGSLCPVRNGSTRCDRAQTADARFCGSGISADDSNDCLSSGV